MHKLKITQIGNSLGIILPKEVLVQMQLEKGEAIFLVPGQTGSYKLTTFDPEIEDQINKAIEITKRYKNTLKKLAE